jgi:hypothetical protein
VPADTALDQAVVSEAVQAAVTPISRAAANTGAFEQGGGMMWSCRASTFSTEVVTTLEVHGFPVELESALGQPVLS